MDLNLSLGVKIEKLGKPLTLGGGVCKKILTFQKLLKLLQQNMGGSRWTCKAQICCVTERNLKNKHPLRHRLLSHPRALPYDKDRFQKKKG